MVRRNQSRRGKTGTTDRHSNHRLLWTFLAGAYLVLVQSCNTGDVKRCRDQYMQAHAVVGNVDTNDVKSVDEALALVNPTLELCQKANLAEETDQLTSVQRKLNSHKEYLEHEQNRKKLTPEELAQLVAKGDPTCPKGTAYSYEKSGKKIKCTGPQIVDMNKAQAQEYFTHRGFKLSDEGGTFKAESGAVSYTYEFGAGEAEPAGCLVVFATPGIAWQEEVARVTGLPPRRLKRDKPVKTASGEKPLLVEEHEYQAVLKFGDCKKG